MSLLSFPKFAGAYSKGSDKDSTELAQSLSDLEQMNSESADSIVLYIDFLVNSNKNKLAIVKIIRTAGYTLAKYGYLQLAEKYYLDALELNKKTKNVKIEVDVTNSLGVLLGRKGDFVKAESFFLKALLISEKQNFVEGKISSFLKLSTVRIRQNRFTDALKYCYKADSISRLYGVEFYKSELLNNKAIVYASEGKLENALGLFKEIYELAIKKRKVLDQALALQNIGLVYKEKEEFSTAIECLNKAIELTQENGFKEESLRVAINIPTILIAQSQFKQANTALFKILVEAKKLGADDLVLEVYYNLTDLATEKKNYKEAFEYLQEVNKLKSKQANRQKQKALQEASISLGLHRANEKVLESKNLLFQKTRERNILFGIVVFVLILLTFLVFILLRLKRLNDRLNKSKRQLTESNGIKNKLFSIIGHDLRGNQGTTLGILGLIKEGDLDEEETKFYLDLIIKQSESALSTLDDLLLWGQAQIKGTTLTKTKISIAQVLSKSINLNLKAIKEKELTVSEVEISDKVVFMDANHFGFVLRNLISNAIKFTPNNGSISIIVTDFDKNFLKVCVADNGVGISQVQLENVFLPSSKSEQGTNNEKGSGLGLTLCKEFVEANGGQIWAERNPDGGTTVCFTCAKVDGK